MKNTEKAFKLIVEIFNKHKIPFQVSGGFAAKLYGSKRELNDIDFDIPEDKFELLMPDISPYITFGPAQYKDNKWDCYLITLNYEGQEIDICGSGSTKITTKDRRSWIPMKVDFSRTLNMNVFGLNVPVINSKDLIDYKKELDGEHQAEDISAAQQYLENLI
jgi:hypothetical protein